MNTTDNRSTDSEPHIWEYLVSDFLEMACFLTHEEQEHLLAALRKEGVTATAIHAHPSFVINGRIIFIPDEGAAGESGNDPIEECWIYYPREKKIRRQVLKADPQF